MAILIPLRAKYRVGVSVVRPHGEYLVDLAPTRRSAGLYRMRTGPDCCGAGCRSTKKKSRKSVVKEKT